MEYKGDYLYNKKWNGKGYDENGNIIYELNNGNGKIKEYDDNSNLVYEGECLNGKRNGKGKEYDEDNKLIYYGEYLNGEYWNGIEIKDNKYNNKLILIEYINGKKFTLI